MFTNNKKNHLVSLMLALLATLVISLLWLDPALAALTFTNKTTADGLGSNVVYGVYASGTTVYAATFGGLSISTDGGATFTNKTTADGLGNNSVRGVYASGTTVYAATNGGLSSSVLFINVPSEPVGGHTEPASPLALLWPWVLLVAAVATGAIAAAALKRRVA